MSKRYKKRMNEMDSVAIGIVGMCITACFMELWVTMFAGRGKAVLCFPCDVNIVIHDIIGSYAHSHNADCEWFYAFYIFNQIKTHIKVKNL